MDQEALYRWNDGLYMRWNSVHAMEWSDLIQLSSLVQLSSLLKQLYLLIQLIQLSMACSRTAAPTYHQANAVLLSATEPPDPP